MSQNIYFKDLSNIDWASRLVKSMDIFFFGPIRELFWGFNAGTVPSGYCIWWGNLLCAFIAARWDYFLIFRDRFYEGFYWNPICFWTYVFVLTTSGFWAWGLYQTILKYKLLDKLKLTFQTAGLKNGMGRFPSFVYDRAIDDSTRKLRLTRASLPYDAFKKAKATIESSLQIYVESIKDNRSEGTVDFIYGLTSLPKFVAYSEMGDPCDASFFVGRTRSEKIECQLKEIPHFLIAGESGSGKSTFLRQLITSLYVRNTGYKFTLIDLKGGSEFVLFQDLSRVEITSSPRTATGLLSVLKSEVPKRAAYLAANRCQNIDELNAVPEENMKCPEEYPHPYRFDRQIVVIDEATVLFLTGRNKSGDVQQAREAANLIAAQGRAVGIHLFIGVQRPDSHSLDPITKANLGGVLAFRTPNVASSTTMLGNSRAVDLPEISGRAIWKVGSKMQEVQTPLLKREELEAVLKPYRKKVVRSQKTVVNKKEDTRENEEFDLE